jgi:hypothetical protein
VGSNSFVEFTGGRSSSEDGFTQAGMNLGRFTCGYNPLGGELFLEGVHLGRDSFKEELI